MAGMRRCSLSVCALPSGTCDILKFLYQVLVLIKKKVNESCLESTTSSHRQRHLKQDPLIIITRRRTLEVEAEEEDEGISGECLICFGESRTICIVPCGHF